MTVHEDVIRHGIARDVTYFARIVSDIQRLHGTLLADVTSMCLTPYFSLFAHESLPKITTMEPDLADDFSEEVRKIVARSRHSLKLFEDNQRGISGQVEYFRDEIIPAHRLHFRGNPASRLLGKDLGIYRYDGQLIGTTHSLTFNLGIEPRDIFRLLGRRIQGIYAEYGSYFGALGAELGDQGETFVSRLRPDLMNTEPEDIKSEKFYNKVFDGALHTDLNAVLTHFQGVLNFMSLVRADSAGRADYSAFKIRFLTLYHLLASLRLLGDGTSFALSPESKYHLNRLTNSAGADAVLDRRTRKLRNTLMHYNLVNPVDENRISLDDPLFGLVPIYLPEHSNETFMATVDRHLTESADIINEWSVAGSR